MFDAQVRRLDDYQQRRAWLGFPMAVFKKFGEDQGGNLAAVLSYYAFLSLFPLLAVFATVTGFVLERAPGVRGNLVAAVAKDFPVIDSKNVAQLHGSWVVLVVGLLLTLWSGLAVANAAQSAFNGVYDVAYVDRPDFLHRVLRSLVVVVVGFLLLATTFLSGVITAPLQGHTMALGVKVIGAAISVALDIGLFLFLFHWLTTRDVPWKSALPGALLAAILFYALQLLATSLITHYAQGASKSGASTTVATVIGLLSWFYLQARITLLCAEVNVVRQFRLWPRAMRQPPGTEADERSYEMQAQEARYQPKERVEVEYPEGDRKPSTEEPAVDVGGARGAAAVHSDGTVHRGRLVAIVAGTALAAWVHGRWTAHPSAGDSHDPEREHYRR